MVEDPERARTMGQAGRRRAVEEFAWTTVADRTLEVYGKVLG
jgi:starch synthase